MKQIQVESNTMIKMEQADVEGNERIITITGAPDAIQYAQYLLQQAYVHLFIVELCTERDTCRLLLILLIHFDAN